METLTFLVKSIDDPTKLDFEMLQNAFKELDVKQSGTLSLTEVKNALSTIKLGPNEIEAIF
jgi:Ca2+-binding EF-hand superfamily protein